MGRRMISVNLDLLKQAIAKAEENGPRRTQNDVWIKSAEIYNAFQGIPEKITFSVVFLRAKENSIEIKTASAKGKCKGQNKDSTNPLKPFVKPPVITSPFPTTKGQEIAETSVNNYFAELRNVVPERFHSLIEKIEKKNSKSAAIKLNCIACFGYGSGCADDIRHCTSKTCALYLFRPYQSKEEIVSKSETIKPEVIEPTTIEPTITILPEEKDTIIVENPTEFAF